MPDLKIIKDTDMKPERTSMLAGAIIFGWVFLVLFAALALLSWAVPA